MSDPQSSAGPSAEVPGARLRIERLHPIEMAITVELGRARMTMGELLALKPGEIIDLQRGEHTPVDILVNDSLLAHGEIVVLDEKLGIRVTDIAGKPGEHSTG